MRRFNTLNIFGSAVDRSETSYLHTAASQAAMLALTAVANDRCELTIDGTTTTWVLRGSDPAVAANWRQVVELDANGSLPSPSYTVQDISSSPAAFTVDFSSVPGGLIEVTLTQAVTALTITPPTVGANRYTVFSLRVNNASKYAVTFTNTIKWVDGVAPDFTSATQNLVVVTFRWDGTSLHGISYVQLGVPA